MVICKFSKTLVSDEIKTIIFTFNQIKQIHSYFNFQNGTLRFSVKILSWDVE